MQRLQQHAVFLMLVACQQPTQPPVAPPPAAQPAVRELVPQPPSAELKRLTWTARSKDGKVTVTQTASDLTHCVAASTGGAVTWKVDTCLGDAFATWFVNPTGATLLRLDTIPTGLTNTWRATPVVTFIDRGVPSTLATAGDLVLDGTKLVFFGGHFAWAQGTGGLSDQPEPMLSADGLGVDGTSADGRRFHFSFDGPPPPPDPAKRSVPPTTGPVQPLQPGTSPALRPSPPTFDTCAQGRADVARAEQAVRAIEQAPAAVNPCQQVLQQQGADQYALCMMGPHGRTQADPRAGLEGARASLERAQDALRRAQVSGCR